jgi:hypothetical protein
MQTIVHAMHAHVSSNAFLPLAHFKLLTLRFALTALELLCCLAIFAAAIVNNCAYLSH